MQTRFFGFEQRISLYLKGVQPPDLAEVKAKMAKLRKEVEELHTKTFTSMTIIEEILVEEEILNT